MSDFEILPPVEAYSWNQVDSVYSAPSPEELERGLRLMREMREVCARPVEDRESLERVKEEMRRIREAERMTVSPKALEKYYGRVAW